jgi:CheY-like chemotaxis protein
MACGESEIDITVSDTGQGIDPTFLPYVFDRFRQADPTPARRHGGLGLGLAIVRYLIELHGGTVHADSAGFGQGSTFTISLPRMASIHPRTPEPSPRDVAAVGSSDESPVRLQDLHILVIEDEPDARFLLLKILEGYGAKVTAVGTVADAMDKLKQFTPDVLVSDIGLPGEDGYSLIRRVRSLPGKERTIHAIALTAHARAEDRAQALSAGYNEHMAKPFDPPTLARIISSRSSA